MSGHCDLDQSRSPARSPGLLLGGSQHVWGVQGPPHGWEWRLISTASDATPPPPWDEGLCREEVPSAAASSESKDGFPVDVLDFPCFHHSPPWWDLPPAWLWDQLLLALPTVSVCRSLCQSLIPAKEPGSSRTMSPFSTAWSWTPAGTGSSPAPSTGFPYFCWSPAQTGDGCMDWAVSFLNPPKLGVACTSVWQGTVQLPTAHMGAWSLPVHPTLGMGVERHPGSRK